MDAKHVSVHWPVFHNGVIREFLVTYLEYRLTGQRTLLEKASGEDVPRLQGSCAELRILKGLLENKNIDSTAIAVLS